MPSFSLTFLFNSTNTPYFSWHNVHTDIEPLQNQPDEITMVIFQVVKIQRLIFFPTQYNFICKEGMVCM